MQGPALLTTIVANLPDLTKPRRQFVSHILMLFLSVRHRINFLQLARHSDQYAENTMRLHFENYLDFATMNQHLIQQHGSGHYLLALDASYIPKSGKATPGVGKYWSGTAGQALWGLEISVLSAIDVDHRTAWHLDAVQTPDKAERTAKDIGLLDHYAQTVIWQSSVSQSLSAYLAVDAYFAKVSFVNRILAQTNLHIISLLRQDARLRYRHNGPQRSARGRPRQYAGPIDLTQPDFDYFSLSYQDAELRIYSAVVNCPFLKRDIKLAYTQYLDETGLPTHYKLYFSTDLNLSAWQLVKYYRLRYQQEFLIRDAKQFTGLNDCQARSVNKLDSHLNMALSAVNVAKAEQGVGQQPFSMARVKTLYHNRLLLDRFLPSCLKALSWRKMIRKCVNSITLAVWPLD